MQKVKINCVSNFPVFSSKKNIKNSSRKREDETRLGLCYLDWATTQLASVDGGLSFQVPLTLPVVEASASTKKRKKTKV